MSDNILVESLSPTELEPALKRMLGTRAHLSGIGKMGGKPIVHAGAIQIEFIDDDSTDQRSIAFTKIPDLLSIEIESRNEHFLLKRPVDDPTERYNQRYRGLIVRHEDEVLRHSYKKLVQIPEISLAMRPIRNVLIHIHEYGSYSPSASRSKGRRERDQRMVKYLHLLSDLELIARENGNYIPGPKLPRGFAPDKPSEEIYEHFLGMVLQSSHQYLTEVLHLTMIKPFLRIQNSYYWPAHRVGEGLRIRRDRFKRVHVGYYGRSTAKFENHLQSLLHKETLIQDNGMVTGSEEILDSLFKQDFNDWLAQEARIIG